MTSFAEENPVTAAEDTNTLHRHSRSDSECYKNWQRRFRHVLKPKENYYKLKCNKLLKKKLKKYKLRHDGTEDQDVLDVSKILVSSLRIKSPNNHKGHLVEEGEFNYCEPQPRNYLFNMVRRKQSNKTTDSVKIPDVDVKCNEITDNSNTVITEKKHANAFQLLMDSRNKSIGGNSPGKEKDDNQSDNEDVIEKKNIKVKRKLLLEKMAVAKGHRKNKEMEEYQDKIIKKKMDKRAERLKNMILRETKPAKLNEIVHKKKVTVNSKVNQKDQAEVIDSNKVSKKSKAFTIVDIFNTMNDADPVSPEKKRVPKEDEEFLKKLSPSLRKRESMLSYFKKVDKEPECSPVDTENDNLIKVKFQVKQKKKGKKKKLSLKRNAAESDDAVNVNNENDEVTSKIIKPLPEILPVHVDNSESQSETPKRKRTTANKTNASEAIELNNDARPKRSIKRPIKYTDDACMSSSDEELHIFTPKKKKYLGSSNDKVTVNTKTEDVTHEQAKPNIEKKVNKETITAKKSVKLAPIFASKQLDSAALEAKQKFLQSGVPDKLKKIIQHQKNQNIVSSDFPVVVHVQQLHSDVEKSIPLKPNMLHVSIDDICPLLDSDIEKGAYKKLLNLNDIPHAYNIDNNMRKNTQTVLQNLKQIHPKFPVYRTYRYLRGKRKGELKTNIELNESVEITNDEADGIIESPDKLNWMDKYRPMSSNQIIGNFESIKELRKWLISWSENEIKPKSKGNAGSDSSDYYQSDTDSRDSLKSMNNLLILTGPTGCGKTSSVYAVAAELAIKVIEVNASSKRTGKIMLQDLHEATQSHKVNRGTSSTDNSQKSQENNLTELLKKNKRKKGRPKKFTEKSSKHSSEKSETLSSTPLSQDGTRTAMSLILIDDADIIFDQDDGFTAAIVQLVQCSKRPVILITSSLVCPHLQRFLLNGKILKFNPLLPTMLGTWLDIMCLADSGISWPGLGAKFLDYFNGDIRKTVNYLQFYISSYAYSLISDEDTPQNTDSQKVHIDDENSNMSWADHEESEERKITPVTWNTLDVESNAIWTDFINQHLNLFTIRYPRQLFNTWWSVPHLLSSAPNIPNNNVPIDKLEGSTVKELDAMADVLDAISLSDYITHIHPNSSSDITVGPWYSSEYDSVSEQDNIDYYTNKYEVGHEICHTLVTGCITAAQDILKCDRRTEIRLPGMSLQRERDKVVTRHKSLTSYLNPWATLDRRSLALDYWSSCRTMCRIEKSKSDAQVNVKRNNRFCHYLKSVSVLCKSDTFDNLCDSLSEQGTDLKVSNFNE